MKANISGSKIKNTLIFAVIATELSHVFCCVLPTVFSILSLLAGLGLIGVVPAWLDSAHGHIHNWELPIIITSGIIVILGWAIHWHTEKVKCYQDGGCTHKPCDTKKKTASRVLIVATLLFVVNVTIYMVFHQGVGISKNEAALHQHAH